MANNRSAQARKVMVVADPTRESAGALQYALSHAVLEQDELILLHVENPNSWRNTISTFLKMPSLGSSATVSFEFGGPAAADNEGVDFLEEMKNVCKVSQPKIRVRSLRVEMDGKDRATTILSQSKTQAVDVIVIGQKRSFSSALLGSVYSFIFFCVSLCMVLFLACVSQCLIIFSLISFLSSLKNKLFD
ncbi:uncharacterized protein LOC113859317 [Abrus precatorius]|uniref:Uncharacterized protein LOC113859317 n=1 Tax=Abrus precatorius TaxID=3816 RepID=A0A8B8KVK7_ABRPR|nr:uncharacterized protein LOC113859317 [Abrus precatorius]